MRNLPVHLARVLALSILIVLLWVTAQSELRNPKPARGPRGPASAKESSIAMTREDAGEPARSEAQANSAAAQASTRGQDPFAGARQVAALESPADDRGRYERVRVVKTDFKYPYLRIVETRERLGSDRLVARVEMVADHVLVKLRPGLQESEVEPLAVRMGLKVRARLRVPRSFLLELPTHAPDAVPRALDRLKQETDVVAYAEPDYIVHAIETVPDDPRFGELWGLHNTGQTGGAPDADIDAPEAWDLTTGSPTVRVGVIDTGIFYTHEDLAANIWTNSAEIPANGIDDDGNGFVDDVRGWDFANDDNDPLDDHYHGTHVAGTLGAVGNNGKGVVGVCWRVSLLPIKFIHSSGFGVTSGAIEAVTYATRMRADLTSNSWGGGAFSQALKDAIDDAHRAGILFVAAAGNDRANSDSSPFYPASYASPNIIAVAATTATDGLAEFSNFGAASVDLGAPGVGILSCDRQDRYRVLNGTSMAAPHVAGVCALVKSRLPLYTHLEIRDKVFSSVDPLPALEGKCVTGGRLNAFRALQIPPQPQLSFHALMIDDDDLAGTVGNGDGIVNPGERVGLRVALRNLGMEPATGVTATLSLAVPDPKITVVQGTASYAAVPSLGTGDSPDLYLIDIAADTPTPRAISFLLTIAAEGGGSWTSPFSLAVHTSFAVTGTARLDGNPLAGASIDYTGPLSGSVGTAADGTYRFGGIAGTYMVRARTMGALSPPARQVTVPPAASGIDFSFTSVTISGRVTEAGSGAPIPGALVDLRGDLAGTATAAADGTYSFSAIVGPTARLRLSARRQGTYFDSLPIEITVPPSRADINFELRAAPDIVVSPGALEVTAEFGSVATASLTLSNLAVGTLSFRFENHVSPYAVADRGDVLRTLPWQADGIAFDGSGLWISNFNTGFLRRVDPLDGLPLNELDLRGIIERPVSLAWDGANLWISDQELRQIVCVNPATRQFVRRFDYPDNLTASGIEIVGDVLYVLVFDAIYKLHAVTGALLGRMEKQNELNLRGLTFYDGALWSAAQSTGRIYKLSAEDGSILLSFKTPDTAQLRGVARDGRGSLWLATGAQGYLLATGDLSWIRESPSSGEVAGMSSQAVTVALDGSAAGYGVHQASIHVKSNDPDRPDVRIPVTFTVLRSGNSPPVAQNQSVVVSPGHQAPVTLAATDAEGDPLTYAIVSFPSRGFLFGTAPNLLYTPFADFAGDDMFTFKANDGFVDGNVATVSISVSGFPSIQVSPASITSGPSTQTLTLTNAGSRALTVRIWNQTSSGGSEQPTQGNVLRVLDLSGLYPAYVAVNPAIGPRGIAFDGESLWVSHISLVQRPGSRLWRINPLTGQLLGQIDLAGILDPHHLAWDGGHLWITDSQARRIHALDTRTLAIVRTLGFPPPDQGGPEQNIPMGLARVGDVLYVLSQWTHPFHLSWWVYKLDPTTGAVLGRFQLPRSELGGPNNGEYPHGLTYLSGSLSVPSFSHTYPGTLFALDPETGAVRSSFISPDKLLLGITSDAERGLWVASRTSRRLYLLDSGVLSWLRLQSRALTIAPGGSAVVTVTLDAAAAGPGNHSSVLHLESNDPAARIVAVPVTLVQPDQPPTAHAGLDQIVPEDAPGAGATVHLNGYRSADADGTIVGYDWQKDGSPLAAGPNPAVTLALGTHAITLTVTDSAGLSSSDSVTITVGDLPSAPAWAWGYNGFRQVGDGTNTDRHSPVTVSGPLTVTALSGGSTYSLALAPDQTLWRWGSYGVLSPVPVQMAAPTGVRAVAAGYGHNLAVRLDQTVWSWGDNSYGQLGDGTLTSRPDPIQVPGLAGIVAVAAGWYHSLALAADGSLWAWGRNNSGQLGDGWITDRRSPVRVLGTGPFVAISAGVGQSVALKAGGSVWVWGSNGRFMPWRIASLASVQAIASGMSHYLALRSDGTVWAWGSNSFGQIGDGTTLDRSAPARVAGLTDVVSISAGPMHNLALKSDGSVWAWGENGNGRLGDGTTTRRLTPVQVHVLTGVLGVSAGKGGHSLAFGAGGGVVLPPVTYSISGVVRLDGAPLAGVVVSDGTRTAVTNASGVFVLMGVPPGIYTLTAALAGYVISLGGQVTVADSDVTGLEFAATAAAGNVWTWGNNGSGQLGHGTFTSPLKYPEGVVGLAGVTEVVAGYNHTFVRTADGLVWGWGEGPLGDGTQGGRNAPIPIPTLSGITGLACGWGHSLAIRSGGEVLAWGLNAEGQVGNGTLNVQLLPIPIGLIGITRVACGETHSLALTSAGAVKAWGNNYRGRLGDGTSQNRLTPVDVQGLSDVVAIEAGDAHSIALRSDGTVWTWGVNASGQLGDGTTFDRNVPAPVPGLTQVAAVVAGGNYCLAVKADGTVWAWGANASGQLGDGTTTTRLDPVQVSGIEGIDGVAAGLAFSLARKSDGTLWAWGQNVHGQLGDNTLTPRLTPVRVAVLANVGHVAAGNYHAIAVTSSVSVWSISGTVTNAGAPLGFVMVTDGFRTFSTNASGQYTLPRVPSGTYTLTASRFGYFLSPIGWTNPLTVADADRTSINFTANRPPTANAGSNQTVPWPVSLITLSGSGADPDGSVAAYQWTQAQGPPATIVSPTNPSTQVLISAGGVHTFRLTVTDNGGATGSANVTVTVQTDFAFGWGYNFHGQVADGSSGFLLSGAVNHRNAPVPVAGLTGAGETAALAGGAYHTLAIKSDATLWSCGRNNLGQLGDGTTQDRTLLGPVPGLSGVVAVAAGGMHSLALKSDGTVVGWGSNAHGQLGDGTTTNRSSPVAVSGLSSIIALAAGSAHSLALKSDGTVWSWGSNSAGQLGDGTSIQRSLPVQVANLTGVPRISAGAAHNMALTMTGNVWTWGDNWAGQLGDGTRNSRSVPGLVPGLPSSTSVAAGLSHSVSLAADGTVWTWGYDSAGIFPDGISLILPAVLPERPDGSEYQGRVRVASPLPQDLTITLESDSPGTLTVPAEVVLRAGTFEVFFFLTRIDNTERDGIRKVVITARSGLGTVSSALFVLDDESLINPQALDRLVPRQAVGLGNVVAIAAGSHTLALTADGSVWGWGENTYGQVGNGTNQPQLNPVRTSLAVPIGILAAGWYHSLAGKLLP